MKVTIEGKIETDHVVDYSGNDRDYIDLYDESTNQNFFDITSNFHGKNVKIIIEEVKSN